MPGVCFYCKMQPRTDLLYHSAFAIVNVFFVILPIFCHLHDSFPVILYILRIAKTKKLCYLIDRKGDTNVHVTF